MQIRQQDPFSMGAPGFYGSQGEFPYPGIGNPYAGMGNPNPGWPTVYNPGQSIVPGGAGGAGSGGGGGGSGGGGLLGGLGNFNLNQVKGFIDKMGGIDGIVSTMTRVQKVVASFQQMAPMLKLLAGSFGGKAAAKSLSSEDRPYPRRKRARKKKRGSARSHYSGAGRTWTPKRKGRR